MATPQPPVPPVFGPPPTPPAYDVETYQLGQLMAELGKDPAHRKEILGLLRRAAPNVPIPELDVQAAFEQRVTETTKPLAEQNTQLQDRVAALESHLKQRAWQEEHGLSDEEYQAVVALAKEKKIGDPNTALEWHRHTELGRPRTTAASSDLTAEERKELYTKPKQWFEKAAQKTLADLRRRQRRGA